MPPPREEKELGSIVLQAHPSLELQIFFSIIRAGFAHRCTGEWIEDRYAHAAYNEVSSSSPLVAAVPAFAAGYAWSTKVNLHEAVARLGINYHVSAFGH
jgi:hypothetical protein